MPLRIGLIVNPIAGIGGPAALKGSDGRVQEAVERGYEPIAQQRALRFLQRLKTHGLDRSIRLVAAPGVCGVVHVQAAGTKCATLGADSGIHDAFATDAGDTENACQEALRMELDLLVFVGGDGTAADIMATIGRTIPVLGVPSGVKMFSECFAETPEAAADIIKDIVQHHASDATIQTRTAEVLDLDEDAYREGRMEVRHRGSVQIPASRRVQAAKCPACPPDGLEEAVGEIRLRMEERPDDIFLVGSGSTTAALMDELGVGAQATLIGIDVVEATNKANPEQQIAWRVTTKDADAKTLEALAANGQTTGRTLTLIVSPIGGQGFIIGRGSAQITPTVLRTVLPDHIWVVATSGKLDSIEDGLLHVDSGDPETDALFPEFMRVIIGVGREKMVRVGHTEPE